MEKFKIGECMKIYGRGEGVRWNRVVPLPCNANAWSVVILCLLMLIQSAAATECDVVAR